MKSLKVVQLAIAVCSTSAFADTVAKPDPWKTSEYSVVAVEGRFAAYIGSAPIILDAKLREKNPTTYLEAIEAFGPAFTSRQSSVGLWEWHFNDGKIYQVLARWNAGLTDKISLKLKNTYIQVIEVK